MRCLPPVDAPFRLIFRDHRPARNWKFTKPLLYRLSYVGACFLIILPLSEGVSGGRENSRPATSRSILAVSDNLARESNESPGGRRSRLVVRAREFRPLLGRRPIRGPR